MMAHGTRPAPRLSNDAHHLRVVFDSRIVGRPETWRIMRV
jgi:hypothetical protein